MKSPVLTYKLKPTRRSTPTMAGRGDKIYYGRTIIFTDTGLISRFTVALSLFYPNYSKVPKSITIELKKVAEEP